MTGFLKVLIVVIYLKYIFASVGDYSPDYLRCLGKCTLLNCTDDNINFKKSTYKQPLSLYITQWTCEDECKYECMWPTVDLFHKTNLRTPQFYGKWPLIRMFGMQEPASVIFSIANALVHFYMIRKFRKEIRADSPMFWLWHTFFLVSVNAWFWSALFHTRDLPITERMDYVSAFSLILINFYMMVIRVLKYKVPRFLLIVFTMFVITFFINHVSYLSTKFDYGYNMQLNIIIGILTAIGWILWCVYYRHSLTYVRKCAWFVALTGIILPLEVADSTPIFYIFDFHSLWHLCTAPIVVLFYSFGMDDIKYLRKSEMESSNKLYKIA